MAPPKDTPRAPLRAAFERRQTALPRESVFVRSVMCRLGGGLRRLQLGLRAAGAPLAPRRGGATHAGNVGGAHARAAPVSPRRLMARSRSRRARFGDCAAATLR